MNVAKAPLHWAETSAILYLVIPLFLFFVSFIRLELAIPAGVLIVVLGYQLIRATAWRELLIFRWEAGYFAVLAIVWSWLAGGWGPAPLVQNDDWFKHNLLINFLADHPWPASEQFVNFGELALRYYIGWHLVPSLFLKVSHTHASALAGSLWSLLGLYLFFSLLPGLVGKRIAVIAAPLVFILFGGADFIGTQITHHAVMPSRHFEWWVGWAQFSSSTTAFFWCPNQALPAWLAVAILMRCRGREVLLPYCALLISAVLLWAPLVTIGLLPFLIALTAQHGVRQIAFGWRAIASTLLLALPVGLYLIAGSANLPHGYAGTAGCINGSCFTWPSYALFLLIEIGAPLLILFVRRESEQGFLIAAACSLCLIPLYTLGIYNDFAMRASLPSLAVLAILCAKLFSGSRAYQWAALAVLALAFPSVLGELTRGFTAHPQEASFDLAAADERSKWWIDQFFAPQPIWVLR